MENTKAVIFDCDGVMFDSKQANINFYNHILNHFGFPPMNEDEEHYVHMHTGEESVNKIFKGSSLTEKAQEYRLNLDYTPFVGDMIIEPGLKEILALLKPDFGLAVATNRSNTIGQVLEENGLSQFFDIIISSLDVKKPKPDPESITKILNFFDISSSKAVYVGDSMVDYMTAKAANVVLIAYKNQDLEADYHADSMEDLSEIINFWQEVYY